MKCIYDDTTSKTIVWNIVKNGSSTVFKLMVKLSPHRRGGAFFHLPAQVSTSSSQVLSDSFELPGPAPAGRTALAATFKSSRVPSHNLSTLLLSPPAGTLVQAAVVYSSFRLQAPRSKIQLPRCKLQAQAVCAALHWDPVRGLISVAFSSEYSSGGGSAGRLK